MIKEPVLITPLISWLHERNPHNHLYIPSRFRCKFEGIYIMVSHESSDGFGSNRGCRIVTQHSLRYFIDPVLAYCRKFQVLDDPGQTTTNLELVF